MVERLLEICDDDVVTRGGVPVVEAKLEVIDGSGDLETVEVVMCEEPDKLSDELVAVAVSDEVDCEL